MANLQITEYLNQFLPPEEQSVTEEIGEEVNLPLEERPATEEIGEEVDLTALASGYQKFAKVPKTTVAQDQADRIKLLIDAGKDETGTPFIYKYYEPQIGRGTLGEVGSVLERATRKDLIPPEVEALLGEEYITKLTKVLGSSEFTTPRQDATFAQAAITRAVGRQGAEESEAEKIAAARGGSLGYFSRLISEWGGKTPTEEEMAGAAPAGASPAVAELYKQYKYSPATSRVAEDIELRYYGRLPVRDKEAFKKDTDRANQAINWMSQLPAGVNEKGEKISVAEDVVGQFLVADINARYGTKDKQYTLEDLNLKIAPTSRGNQLTFMHPTEGRQPIDPVAFEWGDVIEELPGLSVVLADIGGSLAGGALSVKGGPAGIFLGSTAGGAAGAGVAKWFVQDRALKLGGFTYDGSKDGFVGKNAAGKNIVIPAMDIAMGPISEAAWSAGGATLGSALFKVFRSLFTRGASQVEEFMNEKDFLDAYKRYGESKWGQKFREEGLPVPPAVQMESSANLIRQDAKNVIPGSKEEKELLARAVRLENAAAGLRELEKTGTIPKAGEARAAIQDRLEREAGEGVRRSYFDTPEDFGKQVESALRDGDGAEILALLRLQKNDNADLIANWKNRFVDVDEIGDPRAFGESLREASAKILGTQTDNAGVTRTGLYGALNIIRARGQQYNRAVWDLTSIATGVEKQIKGLKKVGTPAYPPKIQKYFDELRQNSRGGELRVTLPQLKALDDLIDQEIKSTGGEAQRKLFNLSANLRKAEGEGFKRINGSLFKEWQEAHQNLKDFRESVLNTSINKMSEGNVDGVAEHLFKSFRDDKIIFETLGDLKKMGAFGQKQTDLLKNILKAKYRRYVEKPLGPEEGPLIAGERRQVAIGSERFKQQSLEAGQHDAFVRDYGPWLRVLFPEDPELDKFARVISQSENIKGGYAKIAKMEKDLRDMSWLENQKFDDISRIAIEEPNKLFDIALSTEVPSRAVKELKGVLKRGLSPDAYKVAEERMKALALRRIWNPGDSFAGTKTGGTALPKVTGESLGVLEKDRSAFIEIFGEKKYNNLRELFTQMNALANPPSRAIPGASFLRLEKRETGPLAALAMLPVKVWVGVLNKKARALNQLSKIQSKGAETKFERLLTDSDALARALKIRKTVKGRLAVNALSSALAVSEDEAQNLIDEYTTTNAQGEIIPVPAITPREGRAEALQ
tara:strand:+ start:2733 stop:6341 length:3609 start_codon:yes stop_codon:yes gene_type:complete